MKEKNNIRKLYLLILLVISYFLIVSPILKFSLLMGGLGTLVTIVILVFLFKSHKLFFKIASYIIALGSIFVLFMLIWHESKFLSAFYYLELNQLYTPLIFVLISATLIANIFFLVYLYKSKIKIYYLVGILALVSIISSIFLITTFSTRDTLFDCSRLPDYVSVDSCHFTLAVLWEKPDYCNQIRTSNIYYTCEAALTENTSYCNMIENKTFMNYCLGFVMNDEDYCTELPEELKIQCLDLISKHRKFLSVYKK